MTIFDQIMTFLNGDDLKNVLGMDLRSYIYDAYSLVERLQQHVVGPLALSILAIFILLEFQKISTKVEGAGGAPMLGFEMIIKALIKFVICYIVILRIQDILDGMVIIAGNLTTRILTIGNASAVRDTADAVRQAVSQLSWWSQLVVLLVMCILFLASLVVRVLVKVTIYLRFFGDVYILCNGTNSDECFTKSRVFSDEQGFLQKFRCTRSTGNIHRVSLVIYPTIFHRIMEEVGSGIFGIIFRFDSLHDCFIAFCK